MRLPLFWKIFLSFWLAMLLMLGSGALLISQLRDNVIFTPLAMGEEKQLKYHVSRFESRQFRKRHFPHLAKAVHKRGEDTLFLLDNQGEDYFGRPLPESLSLLYHKARKNGKTYRVQQGDTLLFGPALARFDRQEFMLFIKREESPMRLLALRILVHKFSLMQLFSALLISALVCLLLAWLITRPIRLLQTTANRIASGDLSVRSRPALGRRNDEFTDLARDFDTMADQVERIIKSQKNLLRDVSHELRSPLARLQVALGLAELNASEAQQPFLSRIDLESNRLNTMIGQLLNLAALERGVSNEERARFDISEMLHLLAEDARFEAAVKNLRVIETVAEELPVEGYYQMLYSALENIVRNALRHSPANSVVEIKADRREDRINIVICDQGPGVAEQDLEKIFEPFFRPSSARERDTGGTGLGLAIAWRGIVANGGHCQACNQQPTGLCVAISLPAVS